MQIERVYSIYFSPTGTTKKTAELVSKVWELPCVEVDITDYSMEGAFYGFTEHDMVYVSVPSYAGRVPETAVKRLQQIKGQHTPAAVIVSYGNRDYDDTLAELKQIMEEQGFCVIGAVAAVTEHSIVRSFGSGRPDANDGAELAGFGRKLREQVLLHGMNSGNVQVKGEEPFKERKPFAMKIEVSDKCTRCGACMVKCPVHAIPEDAPDSTLPEICISCMRCIQICPQNARALNPAMLQALTARLMPVCSVRKDNELFLSR